MGLDITNMDATVGEFQRNYLFFLRFAGASKTVQEKAASVGININTWTEIDLYNKKAIFPERKTNMIEMKYAGQNFWVSGTDASSKTGAFEFNQDEKQKVYKFWKALQELTGNEDTHAAAKKVDREFDLDVCEVDVTKSEITICRRLHQCKVSSVKATDPDKAGNEVGTVTVELHWQRAKSVEDQVGQKI